MALVLMARCFRPLFLTPPPAHSVNSCYSGVCYCVEPTKKAHGMVIFMNVYIELDPTKPSAVGAEMDCGIRIV